MAGTTDAVYGLLDQIWTPALERAKGELAEMDTLLQKDIPGATFESWDWWYYAEKLRKQNYALDEEMLRPYFSLENVQGGIFYLANRLYGITFQPIVVPLYHPDAVAYEVLDADGSHLGVLYFDYFPRDGKSQGAWCGNYVEQTYKDGKRVAPVVSVVSNVPRPVRNTPALLTLDETETLFHEFGHALHFLFHDVKYRGLSEGEGDFVELPSQVMENWAFEPEMLKHYAVHYRTGEVIPKYLVDKLRKSELFNQGYATPELIAASHSDMEIHTGTACGSCLSQLAIALALNHDVCIHNFLARFLQHLKRFCHPCRVGNSVCPIGCKSAVYSLCLNILFQRLHIGIFQKLLPFYIFLLVHIHGLAHIFFAHRYIAYYVSFS